MKQPLSHAEIVKDVRVRLKVSQEAFARLLGVHTLTISRWERGIIVPSSYLLALIDVFSVAARKDKTAGKKAMEIYALEGVSKAIYHLLNAAFR
jgi:DNA-binding transcriptional regulator YiaG